MFDLFISYAHEDKDFTEKLLSELTSLGLNVWYDELQLEVGDSISDKLGQAINQSNFGVLIISNHYLNKQWTTTEMKLFFQLQLADKKKKILPIWYNVESEVIREKYPFLMDIKALQSSLLTIEDIAIAIYKVAKGTEPPAKSVVNKLVKEKPETEKENIEKKGFVIQEYALSGKSLRRTNFKKSLRRTVY